MHTPVARDDSLDHVANLVGAAAVALGDRIREAVVDVTGLQGEAPAALVTVGTRPDRPIAHLADSLGLSHSGTVRLVDRLEARGWVQRRADTDGRAVRLRLTDSGEKVFDEVVRARREILASMLEPLSGRQRQCLEEALSELLRRLPSDRADAWHICRLCEHDVCRGEQCPVGSADALRSTGP